MPFYSNEESASAPPGYVPATVDGSGHITCAAMLRETDDPHRRLRARMLRRLQVRELSAQGEDRMARLDAGRPEEFEDRTVGGYEYVIHTYHGRNVKYPIQGEVLIPRWGPHNESVWVLTYWNRDGEEGSRAKNTNLVPLVAVAPGTLDVGLQAFKRILKISDSEHVHTEIERRALFTAIRAAIDNERRMKPEGTPIDPRVFEHGWEAAVSVDEDGNVRRSFNTAMREAVLKDREYRG